jgi:hypothetical protein
VTAAPAAERTPGHNTTPPRTPRWARVAIAGIVAMSVAARVSAAWRHPGFITGDDWEIHMMTLGHLWASDWEIWSLRSAFYPMAFIYPAQALVSRWAGDDPWILIFTGRLVGVAIATLTLWVAFRITERLTGNAHRDQQAASLVCGQRVAASCRRRISPGRLCHAARAQPIAHRRRRCASRRRRRLALR